LANPEWEQRYRTGDLPWDTGEPDNHLVDFVGSRHLHAGRALEVGCGTGTNSIWLARQGFDVLGIDVSPAAVEKAAEKQRAAGVACRFEVLDFLAATPPGGAFDLVFDRGCFHVFDEADDRARFAERVSRVLGPERLWLSLIGSTEGAPRDQGPPRRSLRDVAAAIEPYLEIVEVRSVEFVRELPTSPRGWVCVAKKRTTPAQPSTRRAR
jgi:SAM-dependent methyltransferase